MPEISFGAMGAWGVSLGIMLLWIRDVIKERNYWRGVALDGLKIGQVAVSEIEQQRIKRREEYGPTD